MTMALLERVLHDAITQERQTNHAALTQPRIPSDQHRILDACQQATAYTLQQPPPAIPEARDGGLRPPPQVLAATA
jgi:hypothetical protein